MSDPHAAALEALRTGFAKQRAMAEKALGQLDERQIHQRPLAGASTPAQIVNHLAGNLASRFTDFLTTDGEKPWRDRYAEFDDAPGLERDELMARWARGWSTLEAAVGGLAPADLSRTITIRAEPHTVAQALSRALDHTAYHTGQVVLLAKAIKGEAWQTITVPPGGSKAHNEAMRGRFGQF